MLVLLQLYWSFLKIGFTSFGGLSMIPLISSEMSAHGWMDSSEISDIVAIAEMTPGPLGLNCASFAGMKAAGVLGAVFANLGVLTPTLTVCALAAVFFEKWQKSTVMQRLLTGIRPACIGMVAGVLATLSLTNYVRPGMSGVDAINYVSVILGVVDMILLIRFKQSIPRVIIFSGVAGLILFGFLGL